MAQKVVTQLIDDLDGTEIVDDEGGNVVFALDGQTYEIDLSARNAAQLRTAMADFVAAARPVSRKSTRKPTRRPSRV